VAITALAVALFLAPLAVVTASSSNSWKLMKAPPVPRSQLGVATAPCKATSGSISSPKCVYTVGGVGGGNTASSVVDMFNPAKATWTHVASLNTARRAEAVAAAP
jgi:hypothetical protein